MCRLNASRQSASFLSAFRSSHPRFPASLRNTDCLGRRLKLKAIKRCLIFVFIVNFPQQPSLATFPHHSPPPPVPKSHSSTNPKPSKTKTTPSAPPANSNCSPGVEAPRASSAGVSRKSGYTQLQSLTSLFPPLLSLFLPPRADSQGPITKRVGIWWRWAFRVGCSTRPWSSMASFGFGVKVMVADLALAMRILPFCPH